eukprot:8355092-Pyramimonas_sp.AAC.1
MRSYAVAAANLFPRGFSRSDNWGAAADTPQVRRRLSPTAGDGGGSACGQARAPDRDGVGGAAPAR